MTRTWTGEQERWLAEVFPTEHSAWIRSTFAKRFGRDLSASAIYNKANELGLHHEPREVPDKAARKIRWSAEPAMDSWMREHDDGCSMQRLSEAFAAEFGFPLSRAQISLWRAKNGRQVRRSRDGGSEPRPVGYERETKGYVVVKVAESPTVPLSKDNWELKQVAVWEREHGVPVPEGHCVVFADRDNRNFEPSNLVAVPRRLMARLNSPSCPEWGDAESLRTAMAWCDLGSAIHAADWETPRVCAVCGREFTPERTRKHRSTGQVPPQSCPDCRAAGKKAKGTPTVKAVRTCKVCGREFGATRKSQVRCPGCIAEKPKYGWRQQAGKSAGG